MSHLIDSVKHYFAAPEPPPKLCGQHTDTFCYRSIKDRHPVTITKIIDQVYQIGLREEEMQKDAKDIAAKLSRLKNRLQTDKEIEPMEWIGEDVELWEKAIELLEPKTWFSAPWLTVECYLYRYIHEVFQDTTHFRYPQYDTFRAEKDTGLLASLDNISQISRTLENSRNQSSELILTEFIKLSLWGNKTDLSLLKHFNLELGDVQSASVEGLDDMILCNDLNKVIQYIVSLKDAKVDIVLDNAGYELFGDLCLGEVLLRSPHVSSVTFHMKGIPWFVSDITSKDMDFIIKTLSESPEEHLSDLGRLWESRFTYKTFCRTQHPFWTTPYPFSDMPSVAPDLYQDLSRSDFVFFKGDLNYRKLVGDKQWEHVTPLRAAVEGFKPGPMCALRTIKSDSIVGCERGVVEKLLKEDKDKLFCGAYAVISSNL